MDLKEYISTVNQKYRAGNATEHTYRGTLEQLMRRNTKTKYIQSHIVPLILDILVILEFQEDCTQVLRVPF